MSDEIVKKVRRQRWKKVSLFEKKHSDGTILRYSALRVAGWYLITKDKEFGPFKYTPEAIKFHAEGRHK
jgi:hypothetical protein